MHVIDVGEIARRMRMRRAELGLSQAAVSERAEIHPSALSRLEQGRHKPDLDTLAQVANALSTSASYLLGETEDPKDEAPLSPSGWRPYGRS